MITHYQCELSQYVSNDGVLSLSFSFNQSGPWWTRSFQKEYLFSLSLVHTGLQEYLQKNGLLNIVSAYSHFGIIFTVAAATLSVFRLGLKLHHV